MWSARAKDTASGSAICRHRCTGRKIREAATSKGKRQGVHLVEYVSYAHRHSLHTQVLLLLMFVLCRPRSSRSVRTIHQALLLPHSPSLHTRKHQALQKMTAGCAVDQCHPVHSRLLSSMWLCCRRPLRGKLHPSSWHAPVFLPGPHHNLRASSLCSCPP